MTARSVAATDTLETFRTTFNTQASSDIGDMATLSSTISATSLVGELNELPVTEVLENVKKSHANKYVRAIETLKGICEHNTGWIKENQ